MSPALGSGTLAGALLSQLTKHYCHKFERGRKRRMKTGLRLHGGVVTQRIANPLPRLVSKAEFLSQSAEKGPKRGPFCHNGVKAALGGLALVLTACGEPNAAPYSPEPAAVDGAPELAGEPFPDECEGLPAGMCADSEGEP